jgi:hypothetical protein
VPDRLPHRTILQATAESHQEFLADGQLDVAAIETFLLEVAKRWEAGSRDLATLNAKLQCAPSNPTTLDLIKNSSEHVSSPGTR